MPLETRDFENQYVIRRLKNQTGTAEGGIVPPPLKAGVRIPTVNKLKILNRESYLGGTQFTLSFEEPTIEDSSTQISNYIVYVRSINSGGAFVAQNPATVKGSPAIIRVDGSEETRVTFTVQTVMQSGQVSFIDNSPSVTSTLIPPSITPSDIPVSTLTDLNVVLGYTNLTTIGGVTWVSATGTINENPTNFFWDNSTTRLGVLTNTPKSSFDNNGSLGIGGISTQTSSFTVGDALIYFIDATSGNITVTMLSAASYPRRLYILKRTDASTNTVTIGSRVLSENQTLFLVSDGTNWVSLLNGFGV